MEFSWYFLLQFLNPADYLLEDETHTTRCHDHISERSTSGRDRCCRTNKKKAKTKTRQWKHCGILYMLLLPKTTGEKRVRIIADLLGSIAKRKSNQAMSVFLSWCSRPSFGVDQGRLYVFVCKRGDQREAIQISKTGKTRHCTDEKNFLVSST